ncbi:Lipid transport protein domain (plasmid) [Herpetosiphon aurantiacus DSM 785]|uniref:Lipid transport protein domain n=1 Tax=Herpetosiphon aurantiacus (strain ATCC 23779 / DSM 785 / 114-95) TaxID=316274 RepID=A9B8L1_HERA2|nr:Lipid transport protein domain [Herpetosiphon aurantiacus DSM 785]
MQRIVNRLISLALINVVMLSLVLFPSSTRASVTALRSYGYRVGSQYDYTWSMDVTTSGTSQNQTGKTTQTRLSRIVGSVTIIPLGPKDDGSMVLEALASDIRAFTTNTEGVLIEATEVPSTTIHPELPFYFAQNPSGRVTMVLLNTEESRESANFKRGIVSLFQMQLSGPAESLAEDDSSGVYEAQYRTTDQATTVTITKDRTQQNYQVFADSSIAAHGSSAPSSALGVPATSRAENLAISDKSTAVFDRNERVLRSVAVTSSVAGTTDGYSGEGVAMTSAASLKGILTLQSISPRAGRAFPTFPATATTNDVITAIQTFRRVTLASSSMAGVVADLTPPTDEVATLDEALAVLSAQPDDLAATSTLRETLQANVNRLSELDMALLNGTVAPVLYSGIIVALSGVSHPQAQSILLYRFMANSALDVAVRNRALMAVVGISVPTSELIQGVQRLSESGPLSEQATLILGALATNVEPSRPQDAAQIVTVLKGRLATAQTPETIILALDALGNAGPLVELSVITPYLNNSAFEVRKSALDALRGYPYEQIASTINQVLVSPDHALRAEATAIAAASGVILPLDDSAVNAQPGEYHKEWQNFIGGGDVKGELLANLHFWPNDPFNPGWMSTESHMKARFWSQTVSVARAKAWSYMTSATATTRYYRAQFYLLGFKVYDFNKTLPCQSSTSGNMFNESLTFFHLEQTIFVYGIPITLEALASASVTVPWTIGVTNCSNPLHAQAWGNITPQVKTYVEGSASVDLAVFRAGIGVGAELFDTSLSMNAMVLAALAPNPGLGLSINVTGHFEPINAHIFIFYQWRTFKCKKKLFGVCVWPTFPWGTKHYTDLWNYHGPAYDWTIINFNN